MKKVIVTVGPQYSGKTTFCKSFIKKYPQVKYISRDEILIELFGTVWLSSYTGGHFYGWKVLLERTEILFQQNDDFILIFDAWNATKEERSGIFKSLKDFGADSVEAWYFVTPVEKVIEWSFEKNPVEAHNEDWKKFETESRARELRSIYKIFHLQKIQEEGIFDSVRVINPLETNPEEVMEKIAII